MRIGWVVTLGGALLVLGCGGRSLESTGHDAGSIEAGDGGSVEAGDGASPDPDAAGSPAAPGCVTDVAIFPFDYNYMDSGCALRSDGTLWCWGGAQGAASRSETPIRMRSLGTDVAGISARGVDQGMGGVDGQACARKTDGTLWCWAWSLPVRDVALGAPVTAVSVSTYSACAVIDDGSLRCWGYGYAGYHPPLPVLVRRPGIGPDIVGLADASWALEANGALWWLPLDGSHADGSPVQVAPAGSNIVEIASFDGAKTVYAVGSDGALRIGDLDTTTGSFSLGQPIAQDVRHVAVGQFQTCIIKTDGALWCTGFALTSAPSTQFSPVPAFGSHIAQAVVGLEFNASSSYVWVRKDDDTLWSAKGDFSAPTQVQVPCPGSCPAGRADCDGDASNGCETDIRTDKANCGGCGWNCDASGPDAISAVCAAGVCKLTCKAHMADCNGDAQDGCETALLDDANNCGSCSNSCKGGACTNGVCGPAPKLVHRFSRPAGIYDSPPRALEVGSQYVYVLDGSYTGAVEAVDKSSGAVTMIQNGGVGQIGIGPNGVLFSEKTSSADLLKQWHSGTTTTLISQTPADSGSRVPYHYPVADSSAVYYVDSSASTLKRYAFGAAAPTTLYANAGWPVALGSSQVIAAGGGGLLILAKTGGNPAVVNVSGSIVRSLAVDGSYAYADVFGTPRRVPLAGGAVTVLATGLDVWDVAVDASNLYARATIDNKPGNRIVVMPKAGGAVQTLAQLSMGTNYENGEIPMRRMAVDTTDVYYLDGWSLMKIAK
jgi:hypothetical protein